MKRLSRRSGFSLVELLTVIAIIAILAAIIFPVMGMVKEKARQNQCITNIKQIGIGLQMFKEENRRYPLALVPVVPAPGGGGDLPFDQAKSDASLLGEYVKGGHQIFHCPSSSNPSKTTTAVVDRYPANQRVYTYNSYEGRTNLSGVYEQHYCLNWADTVAKVDDIPAAGNAAAADYERQLKFRNPPPDTVVTWCSWHANIEPGSVRGKAIVLFLSGEAVPINAAQVEESKWRVRQE